MDLDDVRVAVLQGSSDASGRERVAREIAEETSGDLRTLALVVAGGQRASADLAMLVAALLEPSAAEAYRADLARRTWRGRVRAAWRALVG